MATSESDEGQLLKLVPEDGSAIGNRKLQSLLGWDRDRYFKARDRLVEQKELAKGRGYGGSVHRVKQSRPVVAVGARKYRKETDLYDPVARYLKEKWIPGQQFGQQFIVETTAGLGRRKTGGKWTRPDITVVAVQSYSYVPGKFMRLITFEVKKARAWDVNGVFEVASHSRYATQSYLLIHTPEGSELPEKQAARLQEECKRFNVGLATFKDPEEAGSYKFVLEPGHRMPDPFEMNQFISQTLGKNAQKVAQWK